MPVLMDLNFVVDSTNGNGLGIRSLKGPLSYVQNVFMHTTVTAGVGRSNNATPGLAVTNPNPAAGNIVIQLMDGYTKALSGGNAIVSPAGSSTAAPSAGQAVFITILGTMTTAQWVACGMPSGLTPAVGLPFISNGVALSGASRVAPPAAAGSAVMSIETVGDSNLAIAPNPTISQGFGAQFILQCRDITGALAAPVDGSVISLTLLLSNFGSAE